MREVPDLSCARYNSHILPFRTTAAGLKTCASSQWTSPLIGSLNTGSGRGSSIGFAASALTNGARPHLSVWADETRACVRYTIQQRGNNMRTKDEVFCG